MGYGGEQKPGAAMGARDRGPRRGHRPGTRLGLLRSAGHRLSGVYGLSGLAVLALWGVWSFGVLGCSGSWSGHSQTGATSDSLFANMRQSPEEISRLERNAHYYKLMGQPSLALKEMELAHQENPDNLQITDLLAQNYEELGQFEAARQLYQEALTRLGPHAVLANNLCFSYYRQGRWQEAETCFRQTLDHDPGNVAARNNLGLLYCRLGRQDEARRLWQETEGTAAADAKMGQALAVLGMPASAAYAHKSEPAPPAAGVTQAPTPKMAAAVTPAALPAKPVVPTSNPVVSKTPAPAMAPVVATPGPEPRKPDASPQKALVAEVARPAPQTASQAPQAAPRPAKPATPVQPAPSQASATQLAAQPPGPNPAPVATKPQPEPRKPAVVVPQTHAAAAPAPAPQAASRPPQPPPTATDRVKTAIEVRNGTQTKHLAHQTRSLLQREGFTVARIGNQRYVDTAKTTIYYRPGTERVAWSVCRAVSPQAELAPSTTLQKGIDLLVLLRDDLLVNPQFMARLHDGKPPAATVSQAPAAATHVAAKTEAESPVSGHQAPLRESRATAPAAPPPLAPQSKEVAARPDTAPAPVVLTAAELMGTAIEVRNGTWTKNLAHKTRSLLSQEGFTVAKIGNHVDFGATKTIIYYRPEAEKVARAVANTVFPSADLEPSQKLSKGMDIKVLLGADLLERPLLMAHLFAEAL
jgi:thioredoxin-like negative regulator of GroEL